jgi:hypothetical protein
VLILGAAALAHFGFGVPFRNQPRADARQDLAHVTASVFVQPDAVDFVLEWRLFDTDFHLVSK